MGNGLALFVLVESKEYTAQAERLGDVKRIDDILTGTTFFLAKDPYIFDMVPGTHDIRLIKTDAIGIGVVIYIWF